MKLLNLSEAKDLHSCLKDCIPENAKDLEPMDFVREVIELAKENNPSAIAGALKLLSDKPIMELSPEEKTETFVVGLMENRIVTLMGFFEGLEND